MNFTVGDSTISTANAYGHTLDEFYNTGLVGTALMNSPATKATGFSSLTGTYALRVNVEINLISGSGGDELSGGTAYPLTMDFVTYGQSNDGVEQGDRHMNSIWRFESKENAVNSGVMKTCLLYTSPSPRDQRGSRMPSSA